MNIAIFPFSNGSVHVLMFWALFCTQFFISNESIFLVSAQETTRDTTTRTTTSDADSSPSLDEQQSPSSASTTNTQKQPTPTKVSSSSFDVKDHMDWGSYYDPQSIFCGEYDCYRILGFDYESFGKEKPDTKDITKRYRALSREWHPDKSKHKDAKERFVKIARAYEVLTDRDAREEYDRMRYDQEAYFQKYGSNVLWRYAPKSDTMIVVLFILLFVNGFGWMAQYQRWKSVADRLIRAALEEWSAAQGGTNESKELREHALQVLAEREKALSMGSNNDKDNPTSDTTSNTTTTTTVATSPTKLSSKGKKAGAKSSSSSNKGVKLTNQEKKQKQNEDLKQIIQELAYEIDDFGAGFHKPTWKDLIILKIAKFPYHMARVSMWQTKYWIRRIQKLPLNDNEKAVLTERAIGHVAWEIASQEQRNEMIRKELWILDNLAAYNDEQEFSKLSKGEQKYYKKMMKRKDPRGGLDFKED